MKRWLKILTYKENGILKYLKSYVLQCSHNPNALFYQTNINGKKSHTSLAMSTSSSEHLHMEAWDHQQKRRLVSLISSGLGIQKPPLSMHPLSPQANQSAWELPVHQPYNRWKKEKNNYKQISKNISSRFRNEYVDCSPSLI